MKTYLLNCNRYAKLVRNCTYLSDEYAHESTFNILMELLRVKYNHQTHLYEVPEKLMQKIAIANMCDISLIQLKDSAGDIDYPCLDESSKSVLMSILYQFL